MSPITGKQIDSILPFLDCFEEAGFSPGFWRKEPGQMPWFESNEAVMKFREALYDNGWVQSFDWTEWQDTAREYVNSPGMIESSDVKTIRKLFTTHVRKDRFCEGHLATMFENRHIVALMRRLQQIRDEM